MFGTFDCCASISNRDTLVPVEPAKRWRSAGMGPSAAPAPDPLNPLGPATQRREGEDLEPWITRASSAPVPPAAPEGSQPGRLPSAAAPEGSQFGRLPSADPGRRPAQTGQFDPGTVRSGLFDPPPPDGAQRGPSSSWMPCKVPRQQKRELLAELEQMGRKREKVQLSIYEQPLHINVLWYRGGLVFEAHITRIMAQGPSRSCDESK